MRLTLAGRAPEAEASLMAVPRRIVLLGMYTAATIAAGSFALAVSTAVLLVSPAVNLRPDISIPGLDPAVAGAAGVAVWILFALAGGLRMLRDPGGHATLTFHLPFITAALLLGGPVAGAWVAVLGTIDRRELREAPWYGVLANRSVLALSALSGGLVLEAVLAVGRAVGLQEGLVPWLVAGIAGTLVMAVVSALLTAGTIVLRDGLAPRDTFALIDRSFRRTAVAETLLGWLFVVVWVAAGWWAPALCTAVVLTLWRAAADAEALDHDPLTGVLSRRAFAMRVAEAAERARRGVDGAAYLFLDLDGFKQLNDGPRSHHVGDQVLAALGDRLRRGIRVTDAVGRRGGDEFMILFNGVRDEATAATLAERVAELVTAPYETDDGAKTVGVSIGVALAVPGRRDFEPDLRGHADTAMYEAKETGGGVRIWCERTPD
ncbi:MAG TPA: GGDEF domain-containing protein [Candidatus Limnocylindrales bacterium]|nr:GGDEF domain-containing protein [Candidatus Limnocylindrales bacterium]